MPYQIKTDYVENKIENIFNYYKAAKVGNRLRKLKDHAKDDDDDDKEYILLSESSQFDDKESCEVPSE